MKRIDYSKNEEYRTMIIGVLPMDMGYKLLWQDNIFLEDLCDLEIYIEGNEYLQDYIYSCFRNTYSNFNLSKMYVVSLTSKIENVWDKTREMIESITPVGRIDMDRGKNKFFCREMSSIDRDKVNYSIDLNELR